MTECENKVIQRKFARSQNVSNSREKVEDRMQKLISDNGFGMFTEMLKYKSVNVAIKISKQK